MSHIFGETLRAGTVSKAKGLVAAPIGLAVCLALSSCGAIAEMAVEEVAEEAIGVEIDENDGVITLEGEDGAKVVMETDGDSMSIESDEGNLQINSDNELPEDFDVPVPDGETVTQSTSFSGDEGSAYQVLLNYPLSEYDRVANFYSDYFDGIEGTSRIEATSDGVRGVNFIAEDVLVNVSEDGDMVLVYIQTADEQN